LGFGIWFSKNLNFATCFGDIGIIIWILGNLIFWGGFVLEFVCVVIEVFFLAKCEIWMGLLGFEFLIHIFEKLD
jgi:hypothetical protein